MEQRARLRTAVLFSGRGSNLGSLIDACRDSAFPAEIVTTICNIPGAGGIKRAEQAGIPVTVIDHTAYSDRASFEDAMHAHLEEAGVDFICLAGFMRVLTEGFVGKWDGRMLNIHPSLLPAFPGLDTHQRTIDAGVCISGCTVHFVSAELDMGPIVIQAAVPVLPDDSESTLAARVLEQEHRCYPEALRLIATGDAHLEGGRVIFSKSVPKTGSTPGLSGPACLINPVPERL